MLNKQQIQLDSWINRGRQSLAWSEADLPEERSIYLMKYTPGGVGTLFWVSDRTLQDVVIRIRKLLANPEYNEKGIDYIIDSYIDPSNSYAVIISINPDTGKLYRGVYASVFEGLLEYLSKDLSSYLESGQFDLPSFDSTHRNEIDNIIQSSISGGVESSLQAVAWHHDQTDTNPVVSMFTYQGFDVKIYTTMDFTKRVYYTNEFLGEPFMDLPMFDRLYKARLFAMSEIDKYLAESGGPENRDQSTLAWKLDEVKSTHRRFIVTTKYFNEVKTEIVFGSSLADALLRMNSDVIDEYITLYPNDSRWDQEIAAILKVNNEQEDNQIEVIEEPTKDGKSKVWVEFN